MWGMGRYLYGLKNIWANIDDYKMIDQASYPELEKRYNQYVNQLLKKSPTKGNQQQTNGVRQESPQQPEQKAPVKQPATKTDLPNGRFSGAPARPADGKPQMQQNGCRIIGLQVTRGAKSSQTLVTLENAQGKQLTGYIQGEPPLRQGQIIFNPKITTKSSPVVGNYNIIEEYQLAA